MGTPLRRTQMVGGWGMGRQVQCRRDGRQAGKRKAAASAAEMPAGCWLRVQPRPLHTARGRKGQACTGHSQAPKPKAGAQHASWQVCHPAVARLRKARPRLRSWGAPRPQSCPPCQSRRRWSGCRTSRRRACTAQGEDSGEQGASTMGRNTELCCFYICNRVAGVRVLRRGRAGGCTHVSGGSGLHQG